MEALENIAKMSKLTADDYQAVYAQAQEKVEKSDFKKYSRKKKRHLEWIEAENEEIRLENKKKALERQRQHIEKMKQETANLKQKARDKTEQRHKGKGLCAFLTLQN